MLKRNVHVFRTDLKLDKGRVNNTFKAKYSIFMFKAVVLSAGISDKQQQQKKATVNWKNLLNK